jgi:serine/tyrosine/threonine adenylyltransferase
MLNNLKFNTNLNKTTKILASIMTSKISVPSRSEHATLETINFDNLALRSLPIDPIEKIYTRNVKGACFSRVKPTPVKNPRMVIYSEQAMELLDLTKEQLERNDSAEYFSGNKLIPGSEPAAHCYCGHQFGAFSGQLGDGATMYLGEVVNKRGERWEIQFKGAGSTPYSRTADGRKVLRSSLREFLCSEAMYHLGIPTTRAGTCVTSDSTVTRDIFYNGNPILERCTIILRIAQTFIRFGSFQICLPTDRQTQRMGPSHGMPQIIVTLANYVINTFYPEYSTLDDSQKYKAFFEEIVRRTARLVAEWQCVGWCHGVLNTDNMSIVGVTIDYGPYGFIDRYDPHFICNGSDTGGRYSYANQPSICKWNCKKLGEALQPVLDLTDSRQIVEQVFDAEFKKHYLSKLRKKFGLFKEENDDE